MGIIILMKIKLIENTLDKIPQYKALDIIVIFLTVN